MKTFQMDVFCDFLSKQAKKDSVVADLHGIEEENTQVVFQKGHLKTCSLSTSRSLNLRVLKGAHAGYSNTKDFSLKSLQECYKHALEGLDLSDKKTGGTLCIQENYPDCSSFFNPSLESVSTDKKIAYARAMDQAGQKQAKIIQPVSSHVVDFDRYDFFANSEGFYHFHRQNGVASLAYCLAVGSNSRSMGLHDQTARSYKEIDFDSIGVEAATKALNKQNWVVPKTGRYPVVFQAGQAVSFLLSKLVDFLSGKAVFEGMSLFKDSSLGEKHFSKEFSVRDEPLAEWGFGGKAFDGEGFAPSAISLIEGGVLKNYLTSSFYAQALKVAHTKKASWGKNGVLGVQPFNLEMAEGNGSFKDWVQATPRLIVIDYLKGLAGYNSVSGDFSIESEGFLWEKGEPPRPLCQFTVSGNIQDVFSGLVSLGADSKVHSGIVKAPSFLGPELMISGK